MSTRPAASVASDVRTLLWRDVRGCANAIRLIHREPVRLLGWLFWILFFGWKLLQLTRAHGASAHAELASLMDIPAAMLLCIAALGLVRGEHPAIAFFASPLEARWMVGSHLRPWLSILYVQIRNVFDRLPSFTIFLVFAMAFCLPRGHSLGQFLFGLVNIILLTVCSRLLSLPRELAPAALQPLLIGLGVVVGCVGALAAAEAGAQMLSVNIHWPGFVPILHPGLAFVAAGRGDLRVTLFAGGVCAIALGSLVRLSHDRYPELYELSRAGWEMRSRFREGRLNDKPMHLREQTAEELARIPSGAPVLLWLNWQMYCRQHVRQWPLMRPLLGLGLGALVGLLHIPVDTLLRTFGVIFGLTTTFSSLIDAHRIGRTIRHPIFWLTTTSFAERLFMTLLSWYWRSALDLVCFGLGAFATGVAPIACGVFVGVTLVGVWLQRCVGLLAFALLPSKIDLSGPTAFARFVLALVFMTPPLIVGLVITKLENLLLGYSCGAILAIIEAQGLIIWASRLLDGQFDKILGG